MDPIDQYSRLINLLQKRTDKTKTERAARPNQIGAATPKDQRKSQPIDAIEEVKSEVTARLRALPKNEQASKRAAEVFVETIMMWEFGESLVMNSEFHNVVNQVTATIYESPSVGPEFTSMVKALAS